MKSKKKLLVAMAAMSVAAIGAGTVSTFAWYTASNASLSKLAADNNTLRTTADTLNLGAFELTPIFSSVSANELHLTDNNGDTYLYNESTGANVKTTDVTNAKKYKTISIGLKVVYTSETGTEQAADIDDIWNTDSVTVRISDASIVRVLYADKDEYNAAKDPDVDDAGWAALSLSDRIKTQGISSASAGLKFWKDSAPTGTSYAGSSSVDITFNTSGIDTFAKGGSARVSDSKWEYTATYTTTINVYVGAKGVNGEIQLDTDVYVVHAQVQ